MVKYANCKNSYLCINDISPKTSFKKKSIILLRKNRKNDISKAPGLLIRSLTRQLNYNVCFYVIKIVFLFRIAITTPTNYNSPQLRHRGLPYSPKNRIQPAHPIQTASALPALWQTSSSFYCTPLYYPAWPGSPTHKPYKGYLCRFSA